MAKFKKILMTKQGKLFYLKSLKEDFHSQYGFIKSDLLKKGDKTVKTNKKTEMSLFSPYFIDIYRKIKRTAQIVTLKDIGLIITETGINKKSKIVDAGTGSAALACFLANIAKEVVSYEKRSDFYKNALKNQELLAVKNLKLKNKDIYKGISEKNIDLITLDLPEPWKVLKHAEKALKNGGFLVCYLPQISQTIYLIKKLKNSKFAYAKTMELIKREWIIDEKKARPANMMIGHTGFLTFARKM